MADAAVEFLLENLQELLLHHAGLFINAKDQVEKLDNDLRLFKAYLRNSTEKRRNDQGLRELERQIRDVVNEAQDIIDAFYTQAAERKSKNFFLRVFHPAKVHSIAREVEKIGDKVRGIYGDMGKLYIASFAVGDDDDESEASIKRQENIVDCEDETSTLLGRLAEETQQLDVISIIGSNTEEEEKVSAMAERFCRRFSLAEIQSATEGFSEVHLLGHGGFGKVYKGQIHNPQQTVAVKRLAPNSSQGEGEFLTEIETLSILRHVNLVSLIGYCNENGEMILVYEYIPCGTLANHLSSLTWKQRLNICIGAARGIDYLHTGSSIIHRDVKSTNILLDQNLDKNFTAKVSDFGLAKHFTSNSKSHVSTMVKGSYGYMDPSYSNTGQLTWKSDTFAFGVVLLEVLCGRPGLDRRLPEDEMSLAMWAQEQIRKGKAQQIVASNLRGEISADCLETFLGIAKRCLDREPKKRPTMAQVVVQLEFALEQQDINAPTLKASRFLPFWNRVKPCGSRPTDTSSGPISCSRYKTNQARLKNE